MLSVSHVSLGMAQDYYQILAKNELTDNLSPQARYYAQDKTGLWIGETSAVWGLKGASVTEEVFTNLLAGRSPDGAMQLIQSGENSKHRAAYDLAFSAPKSISILAEILNPSLRQKLYEAHTQSVVTAMKYFEEHFIEARITKDYVTERIRTGNLMAAVFLENATRNTLDPQLHSHVVVPNMTMRPDGKWRAISNEEIYNARLLIGQIYQNELALQVKELGFEVSHKGKGLFEIDHLPADLRQHFSNRSEEIEKKLPELRQRYPTLNEKALRDLAAKWTREKKINLSQEELHELWEARFAELGYNKQELLMKAQSQVQQPLQEVNHAELALKVLTETNSVVNKRDILKLGLQFSIGQKTITDIETELSQAEQAVELAPDLYSNKEIIEVEREVAEQVANSRGQQRPLLELRKTMLIPRELELTADQSATLLQLLSTRDGTTTLVGDAGTGKSTLLKTVVRNYARAGFDIEALSPSALAAAGLKNKGVMKASTVAHYLTKSASSAPRRTLVIVDEASLLSSKDLKAIYDRVKSGDQVLLVGDPKQHQTLSGGSIFSKLKELSLVESSRLTENIRQKEASPAIAQAVRLVAERKPDQAFELLDNHNRLREIADDNERFEAIVDKYVQRSQHDDTLVITQSNAEKDRLNSLIRDRLIQAGRVEAQGTKIEAKLPKNLRGAQRNFAFAYVVGDHFYISQPLAGFRRGSQGKILGIDNINNTIKAKMEGFGKTKTVTIDLHAHGHLLSTFQTKERQFAVGDAISFLKTDRQLRLENGRRGRITALNEDGTMTVETDDGRTVSFNAAHYGYLDYGWAITSFRSQGIDASTVLFSADTRLGFNLNSVYVACSRAKMDLEIFTNSKEDFLNRGQEPEVKPTTLEYSWPSQAVKQGLGLQLSLDNGGEQ